MFEHCESWRVVINVEDQYSIWPTFKAIPPGWREEGKTGTKEECLAHIKEVWVDMRPRSLKEQMDAKRLESAAAQFKSPMGVGRTILKQDEGTDLHFAIYRIGLPWRAS